MTILNGNEENVMRNKIAVSVLCISLLFSTSLCYADSDFDSIVPEELSKDDLVDAYNDLRDSYNILYDLYVEEMMKNYTSSFSDSDNDSEDQGNENQNNIDSDKANSVRTLLSDGDFESIKTELLDEDVSDDLLSSLDTLISMKDDLYYSIDDFEGQTWIFDGNYNYIRNDACIIPYIYLGTGTLRYKIGFKTNDWLFFDTTKIKFDDDEIIERDYDHNEIVRDTLSEGKMSEIADLVMSYEELLKFCDSENITVRFESESKGKYRDYTMSTEAFKNIKTVKDVYDKVIQVIEK
jgi:hypothetical protein